MLLALDVGNTDTVIGVFDQKRLTTELRLHTDARFTADELGLTISTLLQRRNIALEAIEAVVISNVVPGLALALTEMSSSYFNAEPLQVSASINTGIKIHYANPDQVGADRIANVVAAKKHYSTPAIVVDFGTATTFDALSAEGDYLGGSIAPGIILSLEALVAKAALLNKVELTVPSSTIGTNTTASIQSGLLIGYVGLVEGLVQRIGHELGGNVTVIATGGLANLLAQHTNCFNHVNQQLTLLGLQILYEINQK